MAEAQLRGPHNTENMMATLAVGTGARACPSRKWCRRSALIERSPIAVSSSAKSTASIYINDSKATNLDALEKALLAQNRNQSSSSPAAKTKDLPSNPSRPLVARESAGTPSSSAKWQSGSARIGKMRFRCEIANSLADAVERAHAMAQVWRNRPVLPRHFLFRHVQELRRSRRSIPCPRPRPARNNLMKLPSLLPMKETARHHARGGLARAPDEMDYEEMSEPNMKLSRALLIVLVLHVVAVAGIIAFNTIKSRQGAFPPVTNAKNSANPAPTSSTRSTVPAVVTSDSAVKPRDEKEATKPAAKEERKAIPLKPIAENSPKSESKKTYVVAKGDNPASIARKFKISRTICWPRTSWTIHTS